MFPEDASSRVIVTQFRRGYPQISKFVGAVASNKHNPVRDQERQSRHSSDPQRLLMHRCLIALVFVLASPAFAQSYNRSDIVRGLCQPDGCDEFKILRADQVAATEEGSLVKTRLRTFHASSSGRKDRGEQDGYVFCSQTRPAIIAERDGRTMAYYLVPSATIASRETIRRNANFHALYFSACHGPEAGRAAVHNPSGVARGLGYRVSLAQSKTEPLTRAEDILALTHRPPVEASADRSMNALSQPSIPPQSAFPVVTAWDEQRVVPAHELPAGAPKEDNGIMAGPRQLTNRMFDALDDLGNWVLRR